MPSAVLSGRDLLDALTTIAIEASLTILQIAKPSVRQKADYSPVTEADEAAEAVILRGLAGAAPHIHVVSEESAVEAGGRASFFLVDPLDGTREFIAGRPEFTVNIALIEGGEPVMGVVTAPALGLAWRGLRAQGAERLRFDRSEVTPIRARAFSTSNPVALVSRSHLDAHSTALLERIPGIDRQDCGSAVKFCRLAEGVADIYPRLAPTSEWDVAAGHAVLAAAGGAVVRPDGTPLRYAGGASGSFLVPSFLAFGDPEAVARYRVT